MTDIVLPPALLQASTRFRYIDNTGVSRSVYSGAVQTTSLGGDRIGASIDFTQAGGASTAEKSRRGQLLAFLTRLRGKQNRVYLTDASYTQPRGTWASVVGGELFANADFSSGASGWVGSAGGTLSVTDGVAKLSINAVGAAASYSRVINLANAYLPYALRSVILDGQQSSGIAIGPFISDGTISANAYSTSRGYRMASIVSVSGSSSQFPAVYSTTTGYTAGSYVLVPFNSLSQCFLVDGGGNSMLQSDTLDNASWSKSAATVTANAATSPDGTATADAIVENTANSPHSIIQNGTRTSAIADLCTYGYFKRGSGTRDIRLVAGNNGTNYSVCIFNLQSGVMGSVSNVGTATNGRAYMVDCGNGWYFCCVVSRAVAATTITSEFDLINSGNVSYTGDGSSSVYGWRLGATVSSVPTRGAQTTSAIASATSQSGSAIYVKGLPASQSGLLVVGDWIEIDGQLKMVTAVLDSDAAGLGYLQFSPPLYRAVSDNTPIIVTKPMGRFVLAGDAEWANVPGVCSDASLDFEEAFS